MIGLFDSFREWIVAGVGAGGSFAAVRWALRWFSERHDARQARLDAEHDRLDQGWKSLRVKLEERQVELEARLAKVERINDALRIAFQEVTTALIGHDPQSPALKRASQILARAFPDDFSLDLARAEGALNGTEGAGL